MKIKKTRWLFITTALLIVAFIIYLGERTVQHEILTRQSQVQNLVDSRMERLSLSIQSLLEQRAYHIDALFKSMNIDDSSNNNLLQKELDLQNIFIIKSGNLVYPIATMMATPQQQQWLQVAESISYDPSVLYSHYIDSELYTAKSGWYSTYDNIIYWKIYDNNITGYQIAYTKLVLDLIKQFDEQSLSDNFVLTDNGKMLYANGTQGEQYLTLHLDYPLQNWQIDYYYQTENSTSLYILGGVILMLLVLVIVLIFIYSYREYTRTLRLAKQQVSFVGQVSHEFKTPLTNITLYSEMLKERLEDEPEPIPHYLNVIINESQRLTRLIQNVLNFSKAPKLNIKKIHLNELIGSIYVTFKPILAAKYLQLNFATYIDDGQDDIVATDADSVMQIINNFLSNAEKYAAQGKQVDLSIIKINTDFIITVRDYGQGIPAHALQAIFKPFYRVDSALTEGISGTGIGLTIATQLAERLQGTITVENHTCGASFSLILPNYKEQ